MKAFKMLLGIAYMLSAMMLMFAIIAEVKDIEEEISIIPYIIIFGGAFAMMTPLILNVTLSNTFTKNEEEISKLKSDLREAISSYEIARKQYDKFSLIFAKKVSKEEEFKISSESDKEE